MTDQTNQSETDDQAAAAAAAAEAKVEGADSQAAAAWYEGLPDDVKGHASVKKYATAEDAARAIISAESRLGVPADQLLRLPKAKDEKGWAELYDKLGRPKEAKDYGITPPDGVAADPALMNGYLEAAHKAGLSKGQATALFAWYNGAGEAMTTQAKEAAAQAQTEATASLKSEWGQAYDERVRAAGDAAARFGGASLLKFVDESGLGSNPEYVKAWAAVADAVAEAGDKGLPDQKGRNTGGAMTPAQAEAELARFGTDPDIQKALTDKNHPQHGYWTQRRLDLYATAKPA